MDYEGFQILDNGSYTNYLHQYNQGNDSLLIHAETGKPVTVAKHSAQQKRGTAVEGFWGYWGYKKYLNVENTTLLLDRTVQLLEKPGQTRPANQQVDKIVKVYHETFQKEGLFDINNTNQRQDIIDTVNLARQKFVQENLLALLSAKNTEARAEAQTVRATYASALTASLQSAITSMNLKNVAENELKNTPEFLSAPGDTHRAVFGYTFTANGVPLFDGTTEAAKKQGKLEETKNLFFNTLVMMEEAHPELLNSLETLHSERDLENFVSSLQDKAPKSLLIYKSISQGVYGGFYTYENGAPTLTRGIYKGLNPRFEELSLDEQFDFMAKFPIQNLPGKKYEVEIKNGLVHVTQHVPLEVIDWEGTGKGFQVNTKLSLVFDFNQKESLQQVSLEANVASS